MALDNDNRDTLQRLMDQHSKMNLNGTYGKMGKTDRIAFAFDPENGGTVIHDKMKYQDPHYKKSRFESRFSYAEVCPLCQRRMYYPGHIHVWMIVRRSDILGVKENHAHPILMHSECAARYEVTKRLLISAGTIPEDKRVIDPNFIWQSMKESMSSFGVALGGLGNTFAEALRSRYEDAFNSQYLASFPQSAHDDQLDAMTYSLGVSRKIGESDDELRTRTIRMLKSRSTIINEDMKS